MGGYPYLLSRPGEWKEDSPQYLFEKDNIPALLDTFFTKLPKNDERLQLFADLSDPINQYFARDCKGAKLEALTAGSPCYSIGDQLPDCPDLKDLTCAMLVLSVRDYLLPGTQRGPAAALTLSPRVIILEKP